MPTIELARAIGMLVGAAVVLSTSADDARGQETHVPSLSTASSARNATRPSRTGYASVNGLKMYYEIHGVEHAGVLPIVLLHGGGSTIGTNWSRVIPTLTQTRQVIAVELQAHGHTRDIDRLFTFEQCADDVAALLQQLHVDRADIMGFSNGGTAALQIAIRHPAIVSRLIIASANYRHDGMYPWFWDFMQKGTFSDMPQVYKDEYLKINPGDDAGLHAMYERDSKRMLAFKDIPDQEIKAIAAPTLVVVGDKDVVMPEHALELSRLLPHARLCILPGAHGEYMGEISFPQVDDSVPRAFVSIVEEFLVSKS
jgi:pimeloyl-ACP methyl ester carboxylesterase